MPADGSRETELEGPRATLGCASPPREGGRYPRATAAQAAFGNCADLFSASHGHRL